MHAGALTAQARGRDADARRLLNPTSPPAARRGPSETVRLASVPEDRGAPLRWRLSFRVLLYLVKCSLYLSAIFRFLLASDLGLDAVRINVG